MGQAPPPYPHMVAFVYNSMMRSGGSGIIMSALPAPPVD